jgi:hypothetical protein
VSWLGAAILFGLGYFLVGRSLAVQDEASRVAGRVQIRRA